MKVIVSECCNALPLHDIHDGMGICSECKENSTFYNDFWSENDD